jgi:hypothetical protein
MFKYIEDLLYFIQRYVANDLQYKNIKRLYDYGYLRKWQYKALMKRGRHI